MTYGAGDQNQLQLLTDLIDEWRLNKVRLAFKMGVNPYTFKQKLLGTDPQYTFTTSEIATLSKVLTELASEIGQKVIS